MASTSGKKSGELDNSQKESRQDEKGNGSRQKNKTGDSKVESRDSPEIQDREGDITHPRPLSGKTLLKNT